MNNEAILEIIDGIEEAKTCMEDELIWRKVKSEEGEDNSLDGIEMKEIEDSEKEKEIIKNNELKILWSKDLRIS